jgi:hypothetical protein
VLQRLQAAGKCLILFGLSDPEECASWRGPPSGLCLTVQAMVQRLPPVCSAARKAPGQATGV